MSIRHTAMMSRRIITATNTATRVLEEQLLPTDRQKKSRLGQQLEKEPFIFIHRCPFQAHTEITLSS